MPMQPEMPVRTVVISPAVTYDITGAASVGREQLVLLLRQFQLDIWLHRNIHFTRYLASLLLSPLAGVEVKYRQSSGTVQMRIRASLTLIAAHKRDDLSLLFECTARNGVNHLRRRLLDDRLAGLESNIFLS
ncbi:hypothetical protein PRIPAC_96652 [Pristionchus pacificus]|uniref:Uncharacterized protein n=1 Tax=Pristionchus pacificus TaxID=54126 RepID=A0A2A6CH27_PRIPA|nr:hypothetical protein PRIPAC_96652 [Pristionchus pacificus]|eukprot:PDM77439.1 hypothetical protein PRIPAC_33169 [Pristionchus pacificus]